MTTPITREEVMTRATMAPWEPETVEYSMEPELPDFPTGKDCSAYVTWCWNVRGDFNTETLVSAGIMYEIDIDQLKPGDAVGHCGPNTGGANGHIQLFTAWQNDDPNDSHYYCWQQNGVGFGPHHDLENWPDNYKAWRYAGISDDPAPVPAVSTLHREWPSWMPANEWFGRIDGPESSHGGYYAREKPEVMAIQTRLRGLGYAEVGPIDGIFGPKTESAVSRWQRDLYADQTEFFGQVWADDWERLFTY